MNANFRVWFRVALCVSFVASLYGGLILLTAALFAAGYTVLGVLSGLVLSATTAMSLALIGAAWSMSSYWREDDVIDYGIQVS